MRLFNVRNGLNDQVNRKDNYLQLNIILRVIKHFGSSMYLGSLFEYFSSIYGTY